MTKDVTDSAGTDLEAMSHGSIELMDRLGIRLADPEQIALRIAERLSLAQTPEELLDENGPSSWGEHAFKSFRIRNIDWLRSNKTQGLGFYALVEAVNTVTGEVTMLTTGATNVVVQLARMAQMDWLDRDLQLIRSDTPTADGYYPERLVKV